MSKPFLVTGQPRSRTAWMAAAATDGRAICFHEPMATLKCWQDVFDTVWHGHGHSMRYVGISDHGLGFHLREILRRLPMPVLIIERPIAEVNASLAKLGLPASNFCDLLAESLAYDHPCIRRVAYDALANTSDVIDCMRHLMPGAFIDTRRLARYQLLHIEADTEKALRTAAERAADMAAFVPADVLARLRLG